MDGFKQHRKISMIDWGKVEPYDEEISSICWIYLTVLFVFILAAFAFFMPVDGQPPYPLPGLSDIVHPR